VWQQAVDPGGFNWANAKAYCTGPSLAGTGWRLPTKAELESIVDFGTYAPAIDATAFPSTPSDYFWSSSPYVGASGYGWGVSFIGGGVSANYFVTSDSRRVRCVRSTATAVASSGSGGAPPGRYAFPASGTVYDTRTALTWQQAVDAGLYTQRAATTYCTGLSLAGTGWRLPNVRELLTLVDPTRFSPAIDPTAFPSTPSDYFWSSSPYVGGSAGGWLVTFIYGYSNNGSTSSSNLVRCVR
jgi:hypothetical protein